MSISYSWLELDFNKGSIGYLDSTEVKTAKSKGINDVFVGMIKEDYDGSINADKIIDKYKKGAYGRMPIFGTFTSRIALVAAYRDLKVLEYKLQNLKEEFSKKFGIFDDVKFYLSKIKVCSKNSEYESYKQRIADLESEIKNKNNELYDMVDRDFYDNQKKKETNNEVSFTVKLHYYANLY